MKQNQAISTSRGRGARHSPGPRRQDRLEMEIAELQEARDHLRRRLEEVELRAEFRETAHRLLAIPFSRYE